VLGIALSVLAVITLAVTAFGNDRAGSSPLAGTPASAPVTSTPPEPQVLATVANLRIQSPVAQGGVTAVGFHSNVDGSLTLQPVGPQANEGLLARLWHRITGSARKGFAWYQLEGGSLRTLDVGAAAGTDVYSPVDGTVVSIRDQVISGEKMGSQIELQPSAAPSLVVLLENVAPDPALTVGANVEAGSSKLGSVVNIASVQKQALASYAPDRGNNVAIEVFPSAALDATGP